eukprot:6460324-Amphidinium_carterae.2
MTVRHSTPSGGGDEGGTSAPSVESRKRGVKPVRQVLQHALAVSKPHATTTCAHCGRVQH